jgi:hypothetical protein
MDGPLNGHHQQFVSVLGLVRIETFLPGWCGLVGRPPCERAALARSFLAKAVFNLPTTRLLIGMLAADKSLRRLCGWPRAGEVPGESTLSRAFAASALPSRLHDALIQRTDADCLVGPISRDSTAIEAREKPVKAAEPKLPAQPKRRRGRPPSLQGRSTPRRAAAPDRASSRHDVTRDAERSAAVLRCRHQAQCEGTSGILDRRQAAHRHRRRRDPDLLCAHRSLRAWQPGRHSTRHRDAAKVTNLYDLMDSADDDAAIR